MTPIAAVRERLDQLSSTALYAVANVVGLLAYAGANFYADHEIERHGCGEGFGEAMTDLFYIVPMLLIAALLNLGWLAMSALRWQEHRERNRFAAGACAIGAWCLAWAALRYTYPWWGRCAG